MAALVFASGCATPSPEPTANAATPLHLPEECNHATRHDDIEGERTFFGYAQLTHDNELLGTIASESRAKADLGAVVERYLVRLRELYAGRVPEHARAGDRLIMARLKWDPGLDLHYYDETRGAHCARAGLPLRSVLEAVEGAPDLAPATREFYLAHAEELFDRMRAEPQP